MKIAIAGYAVEGKSNYRYFAELGHEMTIIDERPELPDAPAGVPTRLGDQAFQHLDDFDMVVRTASMNPAKLKGARKVWSTANEFFAKCSAPIIGVTGTKGKGTTCSFIASILKAAGKTVHLVGNIGTPALDILGQVKPGDIVVYELSSFQLWDIEKSPHVGVVLMIEPDHLDVHGSFEEYVAAKSNILRHQTADDIAIFNAQNEYSRAIGALSPGQKVPFQSDAFAHVADGWFWYGERKICPVTVMQLPGAHNLDNACAAMSAAWPYVQDAKAITEGIGAFAGLPHRLKFIRSFGHVDYYDDSIATTPSSAAAAIRAFTQPKVMIMGGTSKGGSYDTLAETAATHDVKVVLLIGKEAGVMEYAFKQKGIQALNLGSEVTMKYAVEEASRQADIGDVVILSPACASFDMFSSYEDRGDQFVVAVNALS